NDSLERRREALDLHRLPPEEVVAKRQDPAALSGRPPPVNHPITEEGIEQVLTMTVKPIVDVDQTHDALVLLEERRQDGVELRRRSSPEERKGGRGFARLQRFGDSRDGFGEHRGALRPPSIARARLGVGLRPVLLAEGEDLTTPAALLEARDAGSQRRLVPGR